MSYPTLNHAQFYHKRDLFQHFRRNPFSRGTTRRPKTRTVFFFARTAKNPRFPAPRNELRSSCGIPAAPPLSRIPRKNSCPRSFPDQTGKMHFHNPARRSHEFPFTGYPSPRPQRTGSVSPHTKTLFPRIRSLKGSGHRRRKETPPSPRIIAYDVFPSFFRPTFLHVIHPDAFRIPGTCFTEYIF